MSERTDRIFDIFNAALKLPLVERTSFLKAKCGSDVELLEEVESLLSNATETGSAIAHLDLRPSEATLANLGPGGIPEAIEGPDSADRFGSYLLLRLLGEGGMGTVYLAQQTQPIARQVALKVIKLGMASREVIVRFEGERQTLAKLDHPHIAR